MHLSYPNNDNNLRIIVKNTITNKINDSHVTLNNFNIPNPDVKSTTKSLVSIGSGGSFFVYSGTHVLSTSSQDITEKYNYYVNPRVQKFTNDLNAWSNKNLIPEQDLDKVSLFGDINLTNWKYEDLRLTSVLVPFAVIENQTRTEKIADTLKKYIDILSDEGILKNKYW